MKNDCTKGPAGPAVTFWGAAQSVTGSMHLVEVGDKRVLLDCGMVRGRGHEDRQRNSRFPFDPSSLDAVIVSHAHTDHCGNLPSLVRQGFDGPIYCTAPTRDLVGVMLGDSARMQEEDAIVAGVVHGRPDAPEARPLYTRPDAEQVVRQCVALPYDQPCDIAPGLQLRLTDAGHILGSSIVGLTAHHGGRDYRITFTGDLGRRGLPFLRDPSRVPAADLVISESTYGGRVHDPLGRMAERLGEVVRRTAERGGKVLIPAFSLGRTQVVLHYLQRWRAEGLLPRVPLYVDSPLAAQVARVYERYPGLLQSDLDPGEGGAEHLATREEAQERSLDREPCVIVASGGMCEGGRIVQHLRQHLDDPRCTIVLVSYQAPHSVGARLLEKRPTVRFHGRTWNKWAEVVELNGFSGHADHNDFLDLLGPAAGATGKVRLVHGEPEQATALAQALRGHGFADVEAPRRGETVELA
jgi:metallo-beta-lactamase family protein